MDVSDFLLVTIIVDSREHAVQLAERLVEQRLAATAAVPHPHEAWRLENGALVEYQEWALRAVTVAGRFDALCERAADTPGIVMPGVIAAPLTVVHPRFETWLHEVMQACGGSHDAG